MASVAVGSSQTFTAGARDAVFTVVINGGTYATVTGAQSANLGPSPVRRSFGPFAVGESITVAVQSGDAAIVEYGDQTPGEVGGANSWLSGAQTSAGATGVAGVTAGGSLVGPDGAAISTGGGSSAFQALGSVSGATVINLASGPNVSLTIGGATTLSFTNTPATGNAQRVVLTITNGGAGVITWPAGIRWAGAGVVGSAPTLVASGVEKVVIDIINNGGTVTYDGSYVGRVA